MRDRMVLRVRREFQPRSGAVNILLVLRRARKTSDAVKKGIYGVKCDMQRSLLSFCQEELPRSIVNVPRQSAIGNSIEVIK